MTMRAHPNVVEPHEGLSMDVGYTQLRLLLSGEDTSGAFALTEQPLAAGTLAGPLHTHANEDGFIYVLIGRIGAQVAETSVEVGQGGVVLVPRGVKHTFWNPTNEDASVLVNRPGSDGGSGYWFPTPAGSACWSA